MKSSVQIIKLSITGLDPTIFYYSTTNTSRDLDKSDAHFVDVLHTGKIEKLFHSKFI